LEVENEDWIKDSTSYDYHGYRSWRYGDFRLR
jgi:hypothetical protein